MMDDNLPDIVRDYRLSTRYEGALTIHLCNDPDAAPSCPQRLERWKKVRTLGQGGQGQVVLETCVAGGRYWTERAVKRIRLQDGGSKRHYERELQAIIRFSHDRYAKYFVKTLGWYASSKTLYLAMEYLPAGDLEAYIRNNDRLLEDECRQITSQIVSGLALMHAEGFAHRDVKPQNILINRFPQGDFQESWWIKLADFGISKRVGTDTSTTTMLIGTVLYMAPELLRPKSSNESSSDYLAADIWALGITVFFMLTKRLPFQEIYSVMEYAKTHDDPSSYALLEHCQVSSDGQAFVREAMKPQPDVRLDSDKAMRHTWIQAWLPETPASDIHSRSSSVSTRSSFDNLKGLTTEISTLDSQSYSQEFTGENFHTVGPPKPRNGSREIREYGEAKNGLAEVNDQVLESEEDLTGQDSNYLTLNDTGIRDADVFRLPNDDGIHLEAKEKDGGTHPGVVARESQGPTTRLLLENEDNLEAKNVHGDMLFIEAAAMGNETNVQLLLEQGADLEVVDKNGFTPLLLAARWDKEAVARLLLEKGADIEARDKWGGTPLSNAVVEGHEAVIKLLLQKGADIEVRDKWGGTPLSNAVEKGHEAVAKLLLEKGADIEVRDKWGGTPLSNAVEKGHEAVAKLLLEKGAKIEFEDENGRTPLALAARGKHEAVIQLLSLKEVL